MRWYAPLSLFLVNLTVTNHVYLPHTDVIRVQQPEAHIDPTKELARMIAEKKYEEAFTSALHRSDVSIVSWLCSQVSSNN